MLNYPSIKQNKNWWNSNNINNDNDNLNNSISVRIPIHKNLTRTLTKMV